MMPGVEVDGTSLLPIPRPNTNMFDREELQLVGGIYSRMVSDCTPVIEVLEVLEPIDFSPLLGEVLALAGTVIGRGEVPSVALLHAEALRWRSRLGYTPAELVGAVIEAAVAGHGLTMDEVHDLCRRVLMRSVRFDRRMR
jgi:hypothetical protein